MTLILALYTSRRGTRNKNEGKMWCGFFFLYDAAFVKIWILKTDSVW